MLNFVINNETETSVNLPPFLIKNLICKGDKAMTNQSIPYPPKNGNTPEYRTWTAMRARCNNPNVNNYHNYGGRGISVCKRWDTFENFYDDMGPRPTEKHTIDRAIHNKGYSPENCKWATRKEQADNKRNNVNITKDGETHNQTDWGRKFGLSDGAIKMRLRRGMTPEEAVSIQGYMCEPKPFNVYDKNTGAFIGQWRVKMRCAEDLGIADGHIGSVLNGTRPSTNGYIMKYQQEVRQ